MNNTARFKKIIIKTIILLMTGCSVNERPCVKYWHAGSERPYVINGVKYYPQVHYKYDAIGYASWYGPGFHGRSTSTGRIFDKNKLTAAHRTLPLPSVVLVENLSNGKKVKLIVNDRGPFAKTDHRIIDVSHRTAKLLGFEKRGHAKVRVTCLPRESIKAALSYKRKPYPIIL